MGKRFFLLNIILFLFLASQSFTNRSLPPNDREIGLLSKNQKKSNQFPVVKKIIKGKTVLLPKDENLFVSSKTHLGSDALWTKTITGPSVEINAESPRITVGNDNGSKIITCVYFDPLEGNNFLIIKLDKYGNQIWEVKYNDAISGDDYLRKISVSDNGDIYILAEIQDTDFVIRFHILKYSLDGELISDNAIENSEKWMWKKVFLSNSGKLYHTDRLKYSDDSGRWYVEVFNSQGILENRYESELYNWWGTIITDITVAGDGSFIITADTGYGVIFYRFDSNCNLQWNLNTLSIDAFNGSDRIVYEQKAFDHNNNFYFPDLSSYAFDFNGLYCVTSQGEIKWAYHSEYLYFIGFGIDDSSNIAIIKTNNWYLDKDCNVYFAQLDSSGKTIIENRAYSLTIPEKRYSNIDFSFSSQTGYYFILNSIFNNKGEFVKTTEGFGDPISIYDKIYTFSESERFICLDYNLSQEWEHTILLPQNNLTELESGIAINNDELIVLLRNAYGSINQNSLVKIDKNGKTIWTKQISNTGDKNLFFMQMEKDRLLNLTSKRVNNQSGEYSGRLFSKVFNTNGNLIKENTYSFTSNGIVDFQEPIYKNDKLYLLATIEYEEYIDNYTFYGTRLKIVILNKYGEMISEKEISDFGGYKIEYLFIRKFFVDNNEALNILMRGGTKSYSGGDKANFSGVLNISNNGNEEFFDTDFEFPACTLVSYYTDSWGNYYCTWLGGCTETSELVVKLAQISNRGDVKWQKQFPLNSENWAYPNLTEIKATGQIAFFIEGCAAESYERIKTQYYLLNREGDILITSDIGKTDIAQLVENPAGNDLILVERGFDSKLSFLDIEQANVKYSYSQNDLRGRRFVPAALLFSEKNDLFFTLGNRVQGSYGNPSSEIICFINSRVEENVTQDGKILVNGSYPNPFNDQAAIKYILPEKGIVSIVIYNSLGREIKRETLYQNSGKQVYHFSIPSFASGQYFYQIIQNQRRSAGKLLYIK